MCVVDIDGKPKAEGTLIQSYNILAAIQLFFNSQRGKKMSKTIGFDSVIIGALQGCCLLHIAKPEIFVEQIYSLSQELKGWQLKLGSS